MIPKEFIEQMHAELPNAETVEYNKINKNFIYDGKYYAITFYKVGEQGYRFWIYNRDLISARFVNGSQLVHP